jgi:hypothetical protein
MKEYYEEWVNPKTEKTEKILVQEYEFKDLENRRNSHLLRGGKVLIHNTTNDTYSYRFIHYSHLKKLKEIAYDKGLYFEEVIKKTYELLICFFSRYGNSDLKKRTLQKEIEKFEMLLFEEKLKITFKSNIDYPIKEDFFVFDHIGYLNSQNMHGMFSKMSEVLLEKGKLDKEKFEMPEGPKGPNCVPTNYNTIRISSIREKYNSIILNGIRDYDRNNENIEVEAISRYYNQLLIYSEEFYNDDYSLSQCGFNAIENKQMNKCKFYPSCPCYNDYTKPAKVAIGEEGAQLFTRIMQQFDTTLSEIEVINDKTIKSILEFSIQELHPDLHSLFQEKSLYLLRFHYTWKFPFKSDIDLVTNLINSLAGNNRNEMGLQSTTDLVIEYFNELDINKGWEYAFKSELEFQQFATLLSKYLAFQKYELPSVEIKLNRGTYTKVCKVLKRIHSKLSENALINDSEYYEIIRSLSVFNGKTNDAIYKSMNR